MFYKTTDFEFSPTAKNWILNIFKDNWKEKFPHDVDYSRLNSAWPMSPVGKEIRAFLKKFNLSPNYSGINVFLSNMNDTAKTNPHVDVLHKDGKYFPIRSRFNVMILGNNNDPMFWWNKVKWGSDLLKEEEFNYSNIYYKSLAIPGANIKERWNFLGQPDETKHKLLTPSAFVNTESAHALELSPEPRLIVTVAFNQSIDSYA